MLHDACTHPQKSLPLPPLGYNALTGSIPSELGNLSELSYLGLCTSADTWLSLPFVISHFLCSPLSPTSVHNGLTGQVPTELGLLTRLSALYLRKFDISLTKTCCGHFLTQPWLMLSWTDNNDLTGNLDPALCEGTIDWWLLTADCNEVQCTCCDCTQPCLFGLC
jgi:hypothetical protein